MRKKKYQRIEEHTRRWLSLCIYNKEDLEAVFTEIFEDEDFKLKVYPDFVNSFVWEESKQAAVK